MINTDSIMHDLDRTKKIHEFAKITLKAQNFSYLEKSKAVEAVTHDAKNFNIAPNEILSYIQRNMAALQKEIDLKS